MISVILHGFICHPNAPIKIQQFLSLVKTQFGKVIKVLSDNAKELHMTWFLQDQDTIHQYQCRLWGRARHKVGYRTRPQFFQD